MIIAEDEDFSRNHPNLRTIEFELLGISQNLNGGLHPKIFETQMKMAARNLKDLLQVVIRTRGTPGVPKKIAEQSKFAVVGCQIPILPSVARIFDKRGRRGDLTSDFCP